MAKLIIDVTSKNINTTKKQVTELDKATEKLRLENIKLGKELKSLDKNTADYEKESKRLTSAIVDNTAKMKANAREQSTLNSAIKESVRDTDNLKRSVLGLAGAYLSFQGAKELTSSFIRTSDAVSNMDSKIKLATSSISEFNKAQEQLFKISQQTRTYLTDNADLYQRITLSTKELGLEQEEVLSLTESINKSLIVSGTTAEGASALITQLGQAFSSNFQAVSQELNTLKDQAPSLYQELLEGMGVTSAEFKQLAEDGKLSSEIIIKAITKQRDSINSDFAQMAKTVSQSKVQLTNSLTVLVGDLDKASGFSKALSSSFTDLANSISEIKQDDIDRYLELGKNVASLSAGIGTAVVALKTYNKVVTVSASLTASFGGALNLTNARLSASIIASRALAGAMRLIPFVAIASTATLFADSLLTANTNANTLETTLGSTSKELKELSKNQLEYAKILLETELIQTRLERANAIARASNQGFFTSDEEYAKDLAFKDEQIKKFNEQTKKLREIKQLLNDINKEPSTEEKTKDKLPSTTTVKELSGTLSSLLNPIETIRAKYNAFRKELEQKGKATEENLAKLNALEQREIDSLSKKSTALKTSLANLSSYYEESGQYSLAWAEKEKQIRENLVGYEKSLIEEIVAFRKEKYFTKLDDDIFTELDKEYDSELKRIQEIADFKEKKQKEEEKRRKKELDDNKKLISGYGDLAGAIGGAFAEGSKEAKAFQTIQSALVAVNAVNAVLNPTASAGPAGPAVFATMFASVTALLANLGQTLSLGSTKTTVSKDSLSAIEANEGKGTVLGDVTATSDSIRKSLDTLEEFAKPEFNLLSQMNKSLMSIDSKIGGVASILLQQGGFAFGQGYTGAFSSKKNNIRINDTLATGIMTGAVGLISKIAKIPILEDIATGFGGIINSVLGGLFGKKSVSRSLSDAGLIFGKQLLSQALEDFQGSAFQTIKTTVTKKSWFRKSTSTNYTTTLQSLNEETQRQFSLVLDSLYGTVVKAGEALGSTEKQIEEDLSDFYVNIGKLSLKGKSGEQVQELLSNVFGKLGDELAGEAFPITKQFQQVGEGLLQTLTRVATGVQEAEFFINRLGVSFEKIALSDIVNKSGDVGFEALAQSIINADEAIFGLNNGVSEIIETFSGTTSELFSVYTQLQDVRTQFKFLGNDLNAVTTDLIKGAGSTDNLSSALENYITNFFTKEEQLELNLSRLDKEFAKLNLSVPNSKEEFKALLESIDLSTGAGQELYGRLLLLADGFADVAKESEGAIDKLSRKVKPFFNNLVDTLSGAFDSITNLSNKARSALSQLSSGQDSEFQTLVNFNQLISEFNQSKQTTDYAKTEGLYNQIIGIATNLGSNQTYRESIRSFLSGSIQDFDLQKETIKVNIVEGLESLLGLNQQQANSLKESVKDGLITNQELSNIQGLTQEQKDGIIQTAENSNFFATESTLTNLEEFAKLQLESIRKAQEEETESLSAKTFTYGDKVGIKEQEDISRLLGTEYENVEPFIQRVQGLEIASDKESALKDLLGFEGGNINEQAVNYFDKLSPFLGDLSGQSKKIVAEANYLKEKAESEQALSQFKTYFSRAFAGWSNTKSVQDEDFENGKKYNVKGFYAYDGSDRNNMIKWSSIYNKEFGEAYNAYKDYKNLKGFANGGFTGTGNKYDPAGIVHKNEYVVNQEKLRNVGGAVGMESLLRNGNTATLKAQQELVQYNKNLLKQVQDLVSLFRNVTRGGNIMSVSLDA